MSDTYWHKQGPTPLFPDMLWSQPENKHARGKLLIIGGSEHAFAVPAEAYQAATQTKIGTAKVLLPDRLQKTVGAILENVEFAPTNKSGSFTHRALAEWLSFAQWADGVLLAGDLGRNSETAVVLEQFAMKYSGQLTITKDAIDYFKDTAQKVLARAETTLVLSIAQLQKLCINAQFQTPIKFSMTMPQLVAVLHELTLQYPAYVITNHNNVICVAARGEVSTTPVEESETWRVVTAARAATWWIQNPSKPFEALTTSLSLANASKRCPEDRQTYPYHHLLTRYAKPVEPE